FHPSLLFFFLIIPHTPLSTLFPYTTLFRSPDHPVTGSPPAWRQYGRRLDRQADPPDCSQFVSAFGSCLRAEPAPLRSAQTQRPRPARTRRFPLRLPAHRQRRAGGAPVPVLPQATLRPPRQQPVPSPAQSQPPARQQTRNRLPQGRPGHSPNH